MSQKLKKFLVEGKKTKNGEDSKNKKMLGKLHELDDKIEDFIDEIEQALVGMEGENPVFVKKAHQLLANMSKEYSEFMMALRSVVNAVDRKGQILPAFDGFESQVRDVRDGVGNGGPPPNEEEEPPPPEEEEPPPEEEEGDDEFELKVAKKKKKGKGKLKEALLIEADYDEQTKKYGKKMMQWFKDIDGRIKKAMPTIKLVATNAESPNLNVVDVVMRMAKIKDEDFFEHFWS